MKSVTCQIVLLVALGSTTGATAAEEKDRPLPKPPKNVKVDLVDAFKARKSTKAYDGTRPVSDEALAAILWAANGLNRPDGKRTAPSAFGLQYMKLYVVASDGAFLYEPASHALHAITPENLLSKVGLAAAMAEATKVILVAVDKVALTGAEQVRNVTEAKRKEYTDVTAGAIAENIYLMANALGLGTCFVSSCKADVIRKSLKLGESEEPLYLMPLGYPKGASPSERK